MHRAYGGVVPELASRDHIRRVVPLAEGVLKEAGLVLADLDGVAYTQGPGLAGALLVGASVANALAFALGVPAIGVHHLEGHLLSPLLGEPKPAFPFVALLVSGGHTQFFAVHGVGEYALLGDTLDDAAGEAFDKTAMLLGLSYPGGPALAKLAERGRSGVVTLPRPMKDSGDLNMSFSGLKTAVLTLARREPAIRSAQCRHRARIRECDRRCPGGEVARRPRRHRPVTARRRGWRRRQSQPAPPARHRDSRTGRAGVLSRHAILYRQRRHDRARRRVAHECRGAFPTTRSRSARGGNSRRWRRIDDFRWIAALTRQGTGYGACTTTLPIMYGCTEHT